MSKLLISLLAAVFAVVTMTPVAFAADKKDEAKKEMKQGEGKKAAPKTKPAPKSKTAPKKGEGKKAEEKK